MKITFAPRGILQIDDARIIHRNFSGVGSMYNREGDRNFSLVIPELYILIGPDGEPDDRAPLLNVADANEVMATENVEYKLLAEVLVDMGWNVKIKPPRVEGDSSFMYLPVKIKFNDRGPNVYVTSGRAQNRLSENTVGDLDNIDIRSVDLDIRPYDWEMNGKMGRTAYLQSIHVVQEIDRFTADFIRHAGDEAEFF